MADHASSPARGSGRIPPWVEPDVPEPVRLPANRARPVPPPWLDCASCGWRHYPGFGAHSWSTVTQCSSCGAPLPARAATP